LRHRWSPSRVRGGKPRRWLGRHMPGRQRSLGQPIGCLRTQFQDPKLLWAALTACQRF
jgi:hypothetical protein